MEVQKKRRATYRMERTNSYENPSTLVFLNDRALLLGNDLPYHSFFRLGCTLQQKFYPKHASSTQMCVDENTTEHPRHVCKRLRWFHRRAFISLWNERDPSSIVNPRARSTNRGQRTALHTRDFQRNSSPSGSQQHPAHAVTARFYLHVRCRPQVIGMECVRRGSTQQLRPLAPSGS